MNAVLMWRPYHSDVTVAYDQLIGRAYMYLVNSKMPGWSLGCMWAIRTTRTTRVLRHVYACHISHRRSGNIRTNLNLPSPCLVNGTSHSNRSKEKMNWKCDNRAVYRPATFEIIRMIFAVWIRPTCQRTGSNPALECVNNETFTTHIYYAAWQQ